MKLKIGTQIAIATSIGGGSMLVVFPSLPAMFCNALFCYLAIACTNSYFKFEEDYWCHGWGIIKAGNPNRYRFYLLDYSIFLSTCVVIALIKG